MGSRRSMSKLEKFIEEVVNNVRKDREITKRQLVKISTIVQRKESKSAGLTDFDKEELFDIIQSGGSDE